jgi:hypothetical protein
MRNVPPTLGVAAIADDESSEGVKAAPAPIAARPLMKSRRESLPDSNIVLRLSNSVIITSLPWALKVYAAPSNTPEPNERSLNVYETLGAIIMSIAIGCQQGREDEIRHKFVFLRRSA